jgi:mono/diheme cytochrome c family protein
MKSTHGFAILLALGGAALAAAPAAGGGNAESKAGGGGTVDAEIYKGFQTWRAATCDRCHGAAQEGSVGPSLIEGMKKLSKEQFTDIVANGRTTRGVMPAYKTNKEVMAHMDQLYAYLKGRSDGSIPNAKVDKPGP